MMDFSMRCSSKDIDNNRRVWLAAIAASGLMWAKWPEAAADTAEVVTITAAQIRRDDKQGQWVLDADLRWNALPEAWQRLVENGVVHPFVITLQLWQRRWWLANQLLWAKRWRFALVWRPSTRVWWLRHNEQIIAQGSWERTVAPVSQIRGWSLLPLQRLEMNPKVEAELIVAVDETQLGPMLRLPGVETRAALLWQATSYRWQPWQPKPSAPR